MRQASTPVSGTAAAIATSVAGGSIRCQTTTTGASGRRPDGGTAMKGTPAAVPVIGGLDGLVVVEVVMVITVRTSADRFGPQNLRNCRGARHVGPATAVAHPAAGAARLERRCARRPP